MTKWNRHNSRLVGKWLLVTVYDACRKAERVIEAHRPDHQEGERHFPLDYV